MNMINTTSTSGYIATGSTVWNGPVCPTCHRGYIGSHECQIADLQAQIARLQSEIDRINGRQRRSFDPSGCPCNPANGGSGICGCTLFSQTIC